MSNNNDNTVVDGPITPAPVFAYRAIKGYIFGSPQSPTDDANKENIPLEQEKGKSIDKPEENGRPPKKKAKVIEQGQTSKKQGRGEKPGNMPISFTTPQKRRWEGNLLAAPPLSVISPTKGILRTPGQPTPRARSLKDINVTFKGLSPEAATAVRQTKSLDDLPAPGIALTSPLTQVNAQPTATKSAVVPAAELQIVSVDPFPVNDVASIDWQDYVKRTEKEMKVVLRYGQKMRDVAYRKDLENQELKLIIQELKKENKRLRDSKQAIFDDVLDTTEAICGPEYNENGAPIPSRNPRRYSMFNDYLDPLDTRGYGHVNVRNEVNRVDAAVRNQTRRHQVPTQAQAPNVSAPKLQKKPSALESYYANNAAMLASVELNQKGLSAAQVAKIIASRPPFDIDAMLDEAVRIAESPLDSPLKKAITHPKVYAANKLRARIAAEDAAAKTEANANAQAAANAPRNAPPATTGMPPERSAAARERLRQKAEVRKASLEHVAGDAV